MRQKKSETHFNDLRKNAEEILAKKKGTRKELTDKFDELIHELEVHQIELEMQNENLIQTQTELEESRRNYKELYDFAPVGYLTFDKNWVIKRANLKAFEILGITRKYLTNTAFIRYIAPDYRKIFHDHCQKVIVSHQKEHCELKLLSNEKKPLFASLDSIMILNGDMGFKEFRSVVIDITEREKTEQELKKSLHEKEILLKEIHHRVKNNLQVISSLLSLQSEYVKNKTDKELFRESQTRTRSMAIIHEHLYQTTGLRSINFGKYIKTLASDLYHIYGSQSDNIKLKMDVESIQVDINTAIPCGLIINELISNAIKHAFPGDKKGEIYIKFYQKDDKLNLTVKDNGVGLPEEIDLQNIDSLGLKLINTLVDQINGEMEINSNDGTDVTIAFPEVKLT